jgi:CheY-like chemotaxis protein/Tfp pilus assembly protein PilZ
MLVKWKYLRVWWSNSQNGFKDAENLMPKESIAVRVLLVSRNIPTIEFLCQQMQQLAIHVETACDAESATRKLCRGKFEGVFVDLEPGDESVQLLKKLRDLTSHRHAISYAITETEEQAGIAFRAHANFVLQRPFSLPSVQRTLRAAYPMMFRERRRDYRYSIEVRTFVKREAAVDFVARSVNISETGMAIDSSAKINVGERVQLRIELPGLPESLVTAAEICWTNENGRAGMRFVEVPAKLAERLQLWLSERMSELVPGW